RETQKRPQQDVVLTLWKGDLEALLLLQLVEPERREFPTLCIEWGNRKNSCCQSFHSRTVYWTLSQQSGYLSLPYMEDPLAPFSSPALSPMCTRRSLPEPSSYSSTTRSSLSPQSRQQPALSGHRPWLSQTRCG
ncbi:hypothetical protein N306_08053, partial [Opisthocomus hoazin]